MLSLPNTRSSRPKATVVLLLLIVLFIGLPIAEIALLIQVGSAFGVVPTLLACVATGVLGAWLARAAGVSVLRRVRVRLMRRQVPAAELVDGLLIMLAAVVLMTPGFLTDALGLLVLFPPTRAIVRAVVMRQLAARVGASGAVWVERGMGGEHGAPPPWGGPPHEEDSWRPEAAERQEQPAVEILPPERAPKPPNPPRPDIIDVD